MRCAWQRELLRIGMLVVKQILVATARGGKIKNEQKTHPFDNTALDMLYTLTLPATVVLCSWATVESSLSSIFAVGTDATLVLVSLHQGDYWVFPPSLVFIDTSIASL